MAKRSQKTSQASKPPKTPKRKTGADVPGAVEPPEAGPGPGHNSRLTFQQEADLFLSHRSTWNNLLAKQAALDELWAKAKGALKSDGFKIKHMEIADDYLNPKGEKRNYDAVRDRLWVARMIGHSLGRQFDLFENPPTPDAAAALARARNAGRQASIDNMACKPPHSPETPEYTSWINGWQDHQEELVRGGIKKPSIPGTVVADATVVPRSEFSRIIRDDERDVNEQIKNYEPPGGALQ